MVLKYNCESCNYAIDRLSSWNKHIKTKKHLQKNSAPLKDPIRSHKILKDQENFIKSQLYSCKYCNKSYNRSNNRSKHEKKCPENELFIIKYELTSLKEQNIRLTESYKKLEEEKDDLFNKLINIKQGPTNVTNIQYIVNNVPNPYDLQEDERYNYLFDQNNLFIEDKSHGDEDNIDIEEKESKLDEDTRNDIFVENLFVYIKLKTLNELLGSFLLKLYKKKDIIKQSIHVTDCSRLNFVYAELEKGVNKVRWKSDIKGVNITKIIIDPLIKYIEERVSNYQTKLIKKIKREKGKCQRDGINMALSDTLLDMLDETNKKNKNFELKNKILNYIAPRLKVDKKCFELK